MISKSVALAYRNLCMLYGDRLGPAVAERGRIAGLFGVAARKCPVREGRLRWAWIQGWNEGRDQRQARRRSHAP